MNLGYRLFTVCDSIDTFLTTKSVKLGWIDYKMHAWTPLEEPKALGPLRGAEVQYGNDADSVIDDGSSFTTASEDDEMDIISIDDESRPEFKKGAVSQP
jgi:hypothetical protein